MSRYKFKYKRWLFWKTEIVVGHKLENDTMVLYKEDGGLKTIPFWSKHSLVLGADWALSVKKNLEQQTGVDIKTTF